MPDLTGEIAVLTKDEAAVVYPLLARSPTRPLDDREHPLWVSAVAKIKAAAGDDERSAG